MLLRIEDSAIENIWFTSDHHFGHSNIIKYADRPFEDAREMTEAMICNWNKVIQDDNIVIHLADFTLEGPALGQAYFRSLNGKIKVLECAWHHDRRWIKESHTMFSRTDYPVELLPPMVVVEIPAWGKDDHPLAITLCHYPLREWDRKHHGSWHLFGHTHSHSKQPYLLRRVPAIQAGIYAINVSVDAWDFAPVSLVQIKELIDSTVKEYRT